MISQMRNRHGLKKNYLNSRQNTLPINLDDNKYQSRECCTFFIRCELNVNHMKTQCVCSLCLQFCIWIGDFKKN